MKITSIRPHSRRAGYFNLFVDEKKVLSLDGSSLLAEQLTAGSELTPARLETLKKIGRHDLAYTQLLRYVLMRPRSQWEIETYLIRKKLPPLMTKDLIAKLQRNHFIDDVAFTKSWIENRRQLKSVSKRRLVQELRMKHIDAEIIATALSNEQANDQQALHELIDKKKRQSKYENDELKLMQYLARQGFGYEDIKKALGSVSEP